MSYEKNDTLRDRSGKAVVCSKCGEEVDVSNYCPIHSVSAVCDHCCSCNEVSE